MSFDDIITRIGEVLTQPTKFFKKLKKEKGIQAALLYFMLLSLVGTILGGIGSFFFLSYFPHMTFMQGFSGMPMHSLYFPSFLIVSYVLGIALSFLFAGIVHIWLMIFGAKVTYDKTYQVWIYSRTPSLLLGWIPFVSILTFIYSLILLIIGTQEVHKFSQTKAILVYVVPFMVIFFLALIFVALSLLLIIPVSVTNSMMG